MAQVAIILCVPLCEFNAAPIQPYTPVIVSLLHLDYSPHSFQSSGTTTRGLAGLEGLKIPGFGTVFTSICGSCAWASSRSMWYIRTFLPRGGLLYLPETVQLSKCETLLISFCLLGTLWTKCQSLLVSERGSTYSGVTALDEACTGTYSMFAFYRGSIFSWKAADHPLHIICSDHAICSRPQTWGWASQFTWSESSVWQQIVLPALGSCLKHGCWAFY